MLMYLRVARFTFGDHSVDEKQKLMLGLSECDLLQGFFWGGRIWVRGLRYLSVHVKRLPGLSANSSFSITSNQWLNGASCPLPFSLDVFCITGSPSW